MSRYLSRAPLRAVLRQDRWVDVLECGHNMPRALDSAGWPLVRRRRRCEWCLMARESTEGEQV